MILGLWDNGRRVSGDSCRRPSASSWLETRGACLRRDDEVVQANFCLTPSALFSKVAHQTLGRTPVVPCDSYSLPQTEKIHCMKKMKCSKYWAAANWVMLSSWKQKKAVNPKSNWVFQTTVDEWIFRWLQKIFRYRSALSIFSLFLYFLSEYCWNYQIVVDFIVSTPCTLYLPYLWFPTTSIIAFVYFLLQKNPETHEISGS